MPYPIIKNMSTHMKNIIPLFFALSVFTACSDNPSVEGEVLDAKKMAQLDSLKQIQQQVNEQIAALESEINANKPSTVKATPVKVANPYKGEFKHYLTLQGKVENKNSILINPKMSGRVSSVRVEEGQRVRKGQTLATIDASVMYQQKQELETALAHANTLFEKQERLREQNVGTEVDYLNAENQVKSLEKSLASLNSQIALANITSTITGVVDEVFIKEGEATMPGMPAFRVVNDENMLVSVPVSDKYVAFINEGNTVDIIFPDLNDTIPGKISFVSKSIDPVNRTFDIEISFSNKNKPEKLAANMLALVQVNDRSIKDAIYVDKNLIQKLEEGEAVYVAQKKGNEWLAVSKPVKTGIDYSGRIVVEEGLDPADQVVVSGYQDLVNGMTVKIID